MVNIKAKECDNQVFCTGVLETMDVEERVGTNGKYVSANFVIKVEQEISGKMYVNRVRCSASASEKNAQGVKSEKFAKILEWKNKFIPLSSCPEDEPEKASRVRVGGAKLKENSYYGRDGKLNENFKIDVGFLNEAYNAPDETHFEITGVLLDKRYLVTEEGESEDIEISFAVVGYNGRVEKLVFKTNKEMSPTAADYIMTNWELGETIPIYGVPFTYVTTNHREIEQAFGGSIIKESPRSHSDLFILKGPATGLDEENSYDNDDIKVGLADRIARLEAKKNRSDSSSNTSSNANSNPFAGF